MCTLINIARRVSNGQSHAVAGNGLPRALPLLLSIALLVSGILPGSALNAAPVQNTATGQNNGLGLDLSGATVTLNRVGNAVTSTTAEITPNSVTTSVTGQNFIIHVLPVIAAGDEGLDTVSISAPAGYSSLLTTGVAVSGSGLVARCPAPASGEYCATSSAAGISISFGDRITASLTQISISFTADTPALAGSGDFSAAVDDSLTPGVPAQAVSAGNADADPDNANSLSVEVRSDLVDPDQSSLEVSHPLCLLTALQ